MSDLAGFRAALLEGDRRLVRRRRRRAAGGAAAVLATIVLALTFVTPNTIDVAAEAREALARPGLVLHSETEVVLPDGTVQQRISRWSRGDRSRTISVAGGRTVEQAADGNVIRVRLEPGGPVDTLRGTVPDPLLEYREALERATDAEEVTVGGVPAYRLETPRQVAYLRRSDKLPLRVELEGGVTLRYEVEWLRDARLDLGHR